MLITVLPGCMTFAFVSRSLAELVHVNEYLYSEVETDIRKSGEKLFDYVDPKNRAVQIEMEAVCTAYLKRVGGYLAPDFEPVTFDVGGFEQEASVIIPVRNRIRTIEDAIRSVLAQKTTFRFNLIIVITIRQTELPKRSENILQTDVWFIWFRNVPIWGSAVAGTWVCIIRLVASLPSSSIATMYIAVLIRCRRSLMLFMNRTARWLSEPIG